MCAIKRKRKVQKKTTSCHAHTRPNTTVHFNFLQGPVKNIREGSTRTAPLCWTNHQQQHTLYLATSRPLMVSLLLVVDAYTIALEEVHGDARGLRFITTSPSIQLKAWAARYYFWKLDMKRASRHSGKTEWEIYHVPGSMHSRSLLLL